MTVRQNVRSAKRPFGKTSVGKVSVRQNVFRQSVFRQNVRVPTSTLLCIVTALRVLPESCPTLNKPRAIAVDFPSKQPESIVFTTINWALVDEAVSPETAGIVTMASNFPSTGSGVTAP